MWLSLLYRYGKIELASEVSKSPDFCGQTYRENAGNINNVIDRNVWISHLPTVIHFRLQGSSHSVLSTFKDYIIKMTNSNFSETHYCIPPLLSGKQDRLLTLDNLMCQKINRTGRVVAAPILKKIRTHEQMTRCLNMAKLQYHGVWGSKVFPFSQLRRRVAVDLMFYPIVSG